MPSDRLEYVVSCCVCVPSDREQNVLCRADSHLVYPTSDLCKLALSHTHIVTHTHTFTGAPTCCNYLNTYHRFTANPALQQNIIFNKLILMTLPQAATNLPLVATYTIMEGALRLCFRLDCTHAPAITMEVNNLTCLTELTQSPFLMLLF